MHVSTLHQILSMLGAALVLAAYVGHQWKRLDARGLAYNVLNAVGAALLCYVALRPFQAGFAALEGAWTLISVWALRNAWRGAARP